MREAGVQPQLDAGVLAVVRQGLNESQNITTCRTRIARVTVNQDLRFYKGYRESIQEELEVTPKAPTFAPVFSLGAVTVTMGLCGGEWGLGIWLSFIIQTRNKGVGLSAF